MFSDQDSDEEGSANARPQNGTLDARLTNGNTAQEDESSKEKDDDDQFQLDL